MLRRHANSDQRDVRVRARTALAKTERNAGNPGQAWTWVEEYQRPVEVNFVRPLAAAHVQAAMVQLELGRAYDAVSRLNSAKA